MNKILLSTLLLLLVGCSDSKKETVESTPAPVIQSVMNEDVILFPKASITSSGQAVIECRTNLPDNTSVLISLENETLGFNAQYKTSVSGGMIKSVPMGPASGLKSAKYSAQIMIPIIEVQPDSVKAVLGKHGEHMNGSLVNKGSIGKTASITFTFQAGSYEDAKKEAVNHDTLVADIKAKLKELAYEGIAMKKLSLSECGNSMRRYQSEADALRTKANSLPMKYIEMKAATIEVRMCVSCKSSSIDSCDSVLSAIK
ncbi:hypothetical protein [Sulfurovum sp.]|uniref:hypothetical protein n=1 Tax=Sulfurovum sp. TaxID=1969726 RepID=UPI00356460B7